MARYKQFTEYEFDWMGFVRLLIYWKILKHPSKIATFNQNDNYYSDIIKVIYEYNVYATLNFLYNYKYNLINLVNSILISKFNRTTNIIYYDVTSFFFEIKEQDEGIDDLRKDGCCKEERKQPIVQIATSELDMHFLKCYDFYI